MKRKQVRGSGRIAGAYCAPGKDLVRRLATIKFLVGILLLSSTAKGQMITVDGSPSDWPAVLSSTSVSFKQYVVDPLNSHTDDVWTRGSQSTDPISGWHWTLGNTNDKTDLGNTAVALIGHNLYFCADLYANNGNASIGLWLLKGGAAPSTGGDFSGSHVDGDILVSIAFTGGHHTATPTIYKWLGGSLTHVTVGATVAAAATNSVTVAAPWPYTPKHGSTGYYPTNSFFEGSVNLDSIGAAFNACFGSFVFQTWESQSPHAALADLVAGTFPAGPTVTIMNDTVCSGSAATFSASATGGGSLSYSWNGGSFGSSSTYTISPASSSETITVIAKSSNGCQSATGTAQLVVIPVPVINPVGSSSYCSGTPVSGYTFTSPGTGATFTWTSSANVGFGGSGTGNIGAFTAVTGSTATTATITVTPVNNGCPGSPVSFSVCVNPTPVMTALDTGLCSGSSVSLSGSPAGGTWSGYGVSGSSFNAVGISPGVYTVSYWMTGAAGCTGSATAHVTVRNCECSGRFKLAATSGTINEFAVYPNPGSGSFYLSVPAMTADAQVTLTDALGRIIDRRLVLKNDDGQQLTYSLGAASSGIYYILVENKSVRYANKVIVR